MTIPTTLVIVAFAAVAGVFSGIGSEIATRLLYRIAAHLKRRSLPMTDLERLKVEMDAAEAAYDAAYDAYEAALAAQEKETDA